MTNIPHGNETVSACNIAAVCNHISMVQRVHKHCAILRVMPHPTSHMPPATQLLTLALAHGKKHGNPKKILVTGEPMTRRP